MAEQFNITPQFDLSGLPQYAENDKADVKSDATKPKKIDYSLYGEGFSKEFIDKMENDKRFQRVLELTKTNEGGYANHPNDRGGKTMYGISSKWYPNEDIENLTRERANAILYRDYWLKPHINQLPDEFADIVFDDGVVQGQPTAIINLQKALGTRVDGIIGPNTLRAFENANYNNIKENFIRNVNNVEDNYLQNDPSQKVFEKGHRARFNKY
jgi:lysozyme family protein